jgi:uncharacterized protein YaaQ
MKISELLDSIRKQDLVLPEFQREYVWTREQAKQLMVSLTKGYPVGGLLFWKTDDPPELKNIDKLPEKLGTIEVILDGQQRLTTLYMLLTGDIPPFYRQRDVQYDPRDLYYNLGDADFQYYQSSKMGGNPLWIRVVDCYTGKEVSVFKIAKELSESDEQTIDLAEHFNANLNSLKQIGQLDLPVQIVPPQATITESIDIFDRVNSQGTKLTDADLALTHVTGKWPQARRDIKKKVEALKGKNFDFDLTFMTRALTGVVTKRALYEQIHSRSREELLAGWDQLVKVLDYLVSILPESAKIHSTEDLNTNNVLVPLIVYLSESGGHFPSEKAMKQAIHWLYAAHTWSRYTAQTDQRLEHDLSLVVRHQSPWPHLIEQIVDQRGRIEVKASDLEGRGIAHPLYRMTFILSKNCGAVDWFNGVPLGTPYGKAYRLHSHHIFPQSLLYNGDFDPDNHLHRKIVNEIANRAYLTADSNIDLSNTPPEDYLPEVEKKYPGALKKQFIPMDPELWRIERYTDFLEARREMMARKINEFMDALIAEPEVLFEKSIEELILLGESATLEFKSTLQWDVIQSSINKNLRFSSLKTIAGFLNSAGGTLIIGVEDDGNVIGLGNDLASMGQSLDRFEQLLTEMITYRIGPQFAKFVRIRFEKIGDKVICAVDVETGTTPAFMESPRGKEFYVRVGNTTRSLDPEETVNYIQMNWG